MHARIENKGDRWYVTDMGSRNGTQLNGEDTEGETQLDSGDELRIGRLKIVFSVSVPVVVMDADDERTFVEDWESETDGFDAQPDDETEPISSKQSGMEWVEEEVTPVSDAEAEMVGPEAEEEEDDFGLGNSDDRDLDKDDTPAEAVDWEEEMMTVDGFEGDSAPSPTTPAEAPRRHGVVFAAAGAAIFILVAGAGAAGYFMFFKPNPHVEEQAVTDSAGEDASDPADKGDSEAESENEGDETAPTDDPGGNEFPGMGDEPAPEEDPAPDSVPEEDEAPDEDPGLDSDVPVELPEIDGGAVELPE
jgi:predicted component of type VI protein secretion system